MIELEFIDNVSGATLAEFRGNVPSEGDTIVFGHPTYDEGEEVAYVVLGSPRRYYYEVKGDRFEIASITVVRSE